MLQIIRSNPFRSYKKAWEPLKNSDIKGCQALFFYHRHKRLSQPEAETHIGDRRTHLANERTFLAWIRTSVAIMAFGFLVEKFSLFLWMGFKIDRSREFVSLAASNLLGVILVGMGALLGIFALFRYLRVQKDIEQNTFRPSLVLDALCGLIFFVLSATLFYYILNWHSILIMNH